MKKNPFAYRILLITGLILFQTLYLSGIKQSKTDTTLPRLQTEMKVDGILNEGAWKQSLRLELAYETEPGENIPAMVKTDILMFYTRHRLYIAVKCYDPDPSKIRARYSNRDNSFNDDMVMINLDTFNDERRNYFLGCNPLGVQTDGIETQGGNPSWDAIWYSKGKITDFGYVLEIAIPFSSLQFPRKSGQQTWGLDISRWYQRNYRHRMGLVKIDRNNNSYQSQFLKINGFEEIRSGKNIEIIPTLTGVKTDKRDPFPEGDFQSDTQTLDPGLTTKWGLTTNLTLSGTINPDFSQVEADARQLDINQPFALFFQEKRPFFTEGSDFFASPINIIYTRTIREPEWGIKLSGKEGNNTIGAYLVRDEITNLIFPGNQGSRSTTIKEASTAAVLRYKRDFGSNYTLGTTFSNRQSTDYHNRVFGIDGEARISKKHRLQFQLAASDTEYSEETAKTYQQQDTRLKDLAYYIGYEYASRQLYFYSRYQVVGNRFRADLGFMPKVDYRNFFSHIHYKWLRNSGFWSQIRVGSRYENARSEENEFLEESIEAYFDLQGIKRLQFYTEYEYSREAYNGVIYKLDEIYGNFGLQPYADLQISFNYKLGDRIDYANARQGSRISLNGEIGMSIGRHFRGNIDHTFEQMRVLDNKLYIANITQLSAIYHFNTKLFLRAILQYIHYDRNPENYLFEIDPIYKELFTQFLFSYQLNPRTVLFLGYTDKYLGYQPYRSNFDIPLTQKQRTFFLKLSYSWQI